MALVGLSTSGKGGATEEPQQACKDVGQGAAYRLWLLLMFLDRDDNQIRSLSISVVPVYACRFERRPSISNTFVSNRGHIFELSRKNVECKRDPDMAQFGYLWGKSIPRMLVKEQHSIGGGIRRNHCHLEGSRGGIG